MTAPVLVRYEGETYAVLRMVDDFGYVSYDLAGIPRRLLSSESTQPLVRSSVDRRRTQPVITPGQRLAAPPSRENILTESARTRDRLLASFLVAEDPQHRLDASKTATLTHQLSLVQHVLTNDHLRKVLIADEVGLGKTIEAGLLVKRILSQRPNLRVLYLCPASLVRNVASEFRDKLDLDPRTWIAGGDRDARLESDRLIIASINKSVFGPNLERVAASGPWDIVILDECHHLSDWDPEGGKPNRGYKLAAQLVQQLPEDGRLILMSGTPHQGSETRFRNLLRLLSDDPKRIEKATGRVIYRTKDRVRDWRGRPLFPGREVRAPRLVELGSDYRSWYNGIASLYEAPQSSAHARAAGWAKSQALQWAASSVEAGLGYLARLGIRRLEWTHAEPALNRALTALRPYRGGPADEPIEILYSRITKQIRQQIASAGATGDLEDLDDEDAGDDEPWRPDPTALRSLIDEGIRLLVSASAGAKWQVVAQVLTEAGDEKAVLFAMPVETVSVAARFIERTFGIRPAVIIGSQSGEERANELKRFLTPGGTQFLVSSRAGGEGLNMQVARRLIHLDVPWNPMELEQRIGRVHRFGSRRTVIVDTVVAAGSREVDMYAVARHKLQLIATQLDPDAFESLFSRVMSLVPPKELEAILGASPPGPLDDHASREIGNLVVQGFQTWSKFDERFRKQAEHIRSLAPGEATWADLREFLSRLGDGTPGQGASVASFDNREDEIVAVLEDVPTVVLAGNEYVCADTGGLPIEDRSGRVVPQLGLNRPVVTKLLSGMFAPDDWAGAAILRGTAQLRQLTSADGPFALQFFLRHSIHFGPDYHTERSVELRSFVMLPGRPPEPLDSGHAATVVRACLDAERVRDDIAHPLRESIHSMESELVRQLRAPSDEDVASGLRHVVWPVATMLIH